LQTSYTYNDNNQETSKTNTLGLRVASTYDDGGNLQSMRDPLTGITSYAYDKAERRVRVRSMAHTRKDGKTCPTSR
jgi:YD repeat-containing protein